MNKQFLDFCVGNGIKIERDADFSAITSMKCGKSARYLVEPNDIAQIVEAVKYLYEKDIEYRVVGGMTNTLPPADDFEGVLLRTNRIAGLRFAENNRVYAEAGASLSAVAKQAAMMGIGGFAEFSGIPGTVGGAVFGNAGAHGRSISDAVLTATVYDPRQDETRVINAEELHFGYRDSLFRRIPQYVILAVELRGETGNREEILSKMREYAVMRRDRQPLSMPSLGSIFKHPTGDFAPRIIEELGLKGLSVGGASVSDKHAGFIVNTGPATSEDVRRLIQMIKDEVLRARGISLEEEINMM